MKCGKCKFKNNIGNTEETGAALCSRVPSYFLLIVKTTAIFYQGKKSCIAKTAQDWGVIRPA